MAHVSEETLRSLLTAAAKEVNEKSILLNQISNEVFRLFPDDDAKADRLHCLLRGRLFPDSSLGLIIAIGNADESFLPTDLDGEEYEIRLMAEVDKECPVEEQMEAV